MFLWKLGWPLDYCYHKSSIMKKRLINYYKGEIYHIFNGIIHSTNRAHLEWLGWKRLWPVHFLVDDGHQEAMLGVKAPPSALRHGHCWVGEMSSCWVWLSMSSTWWQHMSALTPWRAQSSTQLEKQLYPWGYSRELGPSLENARNWVCVSLPMQPPQTAVPMPTMVPTTALTTLFVLSLSLLQRSRLELLLSLGWKPS